MTSTNKPSCSISLITCTVIGSRSEALAFTNGSKRTTEDHFFDKLETIKHKIVFAGSIALDGWQDSALPYIFPPKNK